MTTKSNFENIKQRSFNERYTLEEIVTKMSSNANYSQHQILEMKAVLLRRRMCNNLLHVIRKEVTNVAELERRMKTYNLVQKLKNNVNVKIDLLLRLQLMLDLTDFCITDKDFIVKYDMSKEEHENYDI